MWHNFRHQLDNYGLLYAKDKDGSQRLCIPENCVHMIFEMVHDAKHHFGPKRMAHDLVDFSIGCLAAQLTHFISIQVHDLNRCNYICQA
ncbi:hypothetical protein F4811DRAFT_508488 [Daldinia bambusicola]|nr:hypothetical protein F4811DRAFT_508488 [Daldinia bambusicola]